MKKLLCMLLAMLLLAAPAALAEEESLSLYVSGWEVEYPAENEVLVHLLIHKSGSGCYQMEDVEVELYDEAGTVVPIVSAETVVFPLRSVPAGVHYIPVTLRCTLERDAVITDIDVLRVIGSEISEADTEELDWSLPFLATWEKDHLAVTAWMPLEEGTDPADYFAMLLALNGEGYFIGNGELPLGAGRAVEAADICAEIEAATSYTAQWLEENGFVFDRERYVFFECAPLTHLQAFPSSFAAYSYRELGTDHGASIELMLDRIDMQEDGSFVIHGVMSNGSDSLWRLNDITGVLLYDAEGEMLICDDFTYDMPFCVMGAGEYLPYTIEGRVEAGFMAESFQLGLSTMTVDAPDHRAVEGGMLLPSFGETMTFSATMPAHDGVDPADCYISVMFMDLLNDEYYGAVWTYVDEAWLQEGEIHFPTMDGPAGVNESVAMITSYYVAE